MLLLGGADCDRRTWHGLTPLHLAVLGGHAAVVETLCRDGGADPNAGCARTLNVGEEDPAASRPFIRAVKGDTPAHFAAKKVRAKPYALRRRPNA